MVEKPFPEPFLKNKNLAHLRWPRTDIWFLFIILLFVIFLLIFTLFYFVNFVFVFILFSFCFHFVHFHYLIFLMVLFFPFYYFLISFRLLKWNQKKTTWPRADITHKINYNGRGLTYACAAAECQIKLCEKFTYFACTAWKAMKHALLFIKKHGTKLASFSCYYHFLHYDIWVKTLYTTLCVLHWDVST